MSKAELKTHEAPVGEAAVVRVSRVIDAPVAQVWQAWTTPSLMKAWWGKSIGLECHLCEMEVTPGGRYRYGMRKIGAADTHADVEGEFLAVEPPHRLAYTWSWTKEEPRVRNTLVTVTFAQEGDDKTVVTVLHERQPSEEVSESHRKGWTAKLEDLAVELQA
ncbi:MAG: SRPBCC domain-containing protein [Pseudomonadota bacterium]